MTLTERLHTLMSPSSVFSWLLLAYGAWHVAWNTGTFIFKWHAPLINRLYSTATRTFKSMDIHSHVKRLETGLKCAQCFCVLKYIQVYTLEQLCFAYIEIRLIHLPESSQWLIKQTSGNRYTNPNRESYYSDVIGPVNRRHPQCVP